LISLVPNADPLTEANFCHNPGGANGGQFCSGAPGGVRPPLTGGGPKSSRPLPDFLKNDVRAALQAGIVTYHDQQPEPVRDLAGTLHDPLAKSHANSTAQRWEDAHGMTHYAEKGKIFIVTRGGLYEPERQVWSDSWNPRMEKKELSPADLKRSASPNDIVSTFRHEMGHLLRDSFRGTKKTPHELASEISAWQYAVEITPGHRVSNRMVTTGLLSHAYSVFRAENLRTTDLKHTPRYDFEEAANRRIQAESQRGFVDPDARQKARVFTTRALKALHNYGKILTKNKLIRVPDTRTPSAGAFKTKIAQSNGEGLYLPPLIPGPHGSGN
jgi:hypothetical protein